MAYFSILAVRSAFVQQKWQSVFMIGIFANRVYKVPKASQEVAPMLGYP
jgi:hypothetical protein